MILQFLVLVLLGGRQTVIKRFVQYVLNILLARMVSVYRVLMGNLLGEQGRRNAYNAWLRASTRAATLSHVATDRKRFKYNLPHRLNQILSRLLSFLFFKIVDPRPLEEFKDKHFQNSKREMFQ